MSEPITASELQAAYLSCVRLSQRSAFEKEIEALKTGRELARSSPLRRLAPFIDSDGTLRVGGHLETAHLTYAEKHSVIIPKHSRLAELLIN